MYEQERNDLARMFMWHRLLNEWNPSSKRRKTYAAEIGLFPFEVTPENEDYLKAEEVQKNRGKMFDITPGTVCRANTITGSSCDMICIDDFESSMPVSYSAVPSTAKACKPIQKKENNMGYATSNVQYNDISFNQEKAARDHMESRLYTEYHTKRDELRKKFHMNSLQIDTIKDLKDALANGNIVVPEFFKDAREIDSGWCEYLTCVDKERDEAGYKLADGLLDTAFTKAKDTIKVLPVEKGLEALQQFEAATF